MEMESSRRPFERSREPGLKKPRLGDEPERNPGLNRPFAGPTVAQRPIAGNPMAARLRAAEREAESVDSGRGGGGYQPQPVPAAVQQHQELVSQYREALAELTFNSKPIITNLTIIAGENLHAAKAIAATVCANIIEVPSEQKLPSLYLLDSIVKNIGREYIKNFASRLPEVFCKAYRQVDAPVHQSMRHLFGTWKGVFPAQTLQMIEKELGFAPTVNGSSAGATTSRSDSQSNRPLQNSIHVNPKYLERQQRLQQPNRAKGSARDLSGSIANSIEDAESMDRATSINTGRSWVDPSTRAHNMQRSNRGSESIHEKNIGVEYADYDYGSDFPRNSSLGIERAGGRISEQGHERNLYGGSSSLAESLSGQRNSFNIKHGFPDYPAPKSGSTNAHLQTAKNIGIRSSGGISIDSWKNSDEEEFRWSDMNSRLADHGASDISSNFRKDRSASEDSDKSGLEDHIHKPQGIHDYATRTDKVSAEQKDLGAFRPQTSSLWLSQELHSVDRRPVLPANPMAGSAGALTQQRLQSLKTGLPSSLRQGPPSPTLTTLHPHLQLHGLTEQGRAKTQPLNHPDSKVSQFSGQLNIGVHNSYSQDSVPVPPSHARLGKMEKSQSNDILASSSISAPQQRHQYPFVQKVEDPKDSESLSQIQKPRVPQISNSGNPSTIGSYAADQLSGRAVDNLGDSSPRSLLATVMKSGILSNSSITNSSQPNLSAQSAGKLPSQKGQPLLQRKPIPAKFMNPESKVEPASSASVKLSQKKLENTPLPSGSPPSSSPLDSVSENASNEAKNASDPISNLLSSLVAKGLISASKSESPSVIPAVAPSETQKSPSVTSTSSMPVSSTRDDDSVVSGPAHRSSVSLPKSNKQEIKNLIGFNFKQNLIREFRPTVISDLLDGYEHRCTICGLQLKLQEQLNRHLEWHDMKKAEASSSTKPSRKWYSRDWISGEELDSVDLVGEPEETTEEDTAMVPADESQCACVLCGQIFEDFYSQEKNEWMFKGAMHLIIPSGGEGDSVRKGPIVHANCISESSLQDLGLISKIKLEKDE